MNTLVRLHTMIAVCSSLVLGLSQNSYAQSNQYQRPGKKASATKKVEANSQATNAKKDATAKPTDAQSPVDSKVDITDLEEKYWIPKDTEFKVVQNRTYSKEKRFAATLHYGSLLNDSYSKSSQLGLSLNYYMNERTGIEANYFHFYNKPSVLTDEFVNRFALRPNYSEYQYMYGIGFNWVPIYAKLSLLEQSIIYFDMSFTPVAGMIVYNPVDDQDDSSAPGNRSTPYVGLDIAQHYFLGKHFALRADVKSRFFQEKVFSSRAGENYKEEKTIFQTMYLFTIGITYYH